MRRRLLAAAAALLLVGSLGACGEDDPEPKFGPTPTPTASGSGSPSATDSTASAREPWQRNTPAGAKAFVEHWFAVFSDAQDDGDVAELRAISSEDCVTCIEFADRLEAIYANGGFYESDGWRVLDSSDGGPDGLAPNEAELLIQVRRGAERSKESQGAKVVSNPSSEADYTARLAWNEDRWVMSQLVRLT